MRIYMSNQLPLHYLVGDIDGELWIVPAQPGGWTARIRYAPPPRSGWRKHLQEAPSYCATSLGIEVESRTSAQIAGDAIRLAREEAGLTQVQLASTIGAKQSNLSAWETGRVEVSYGTLMRLRQVLPKLSI